MKRAGISFIRKNEAPQNLGENWINLGSKKLSSDAEYTVKSIFAYLRQYFLASPGRSQAPRRRLRGPAVGRAFAGTTVHGLLAGGGKPFAAAESPELHSQAAEPLLGQMYRVVEPVRTRIEDQACDRTAVSDL